MKNLIYASTARKSMNEQELVSILEPSRRNNKLLDITGVLLYCEGTFIQVLEGDDDTVDDVFYKILSDRRHKDVLILADDVITERNFPQWQMGFASASAATSAKFVNDLTSAHRVMLQGNNNAAVTMVRSFIQVNHLVVT